jgi:hypothetical protein
MAYPILVSLYSHISVFEIIQCAGKFCTGTDTKILTVFNVCLSFVCSTIYASSHMQLTSTFDLQKTVENILIQLRRHS